MCYSFLRRTTCLSRFVGGITVSSVNRFRGLVLEREQKPMNTYLRGALAGFAATIPMTAVMVALHRELPQQEKHLLPPEDITSKLAARAGVQKDMSRPLHQMVTWSAHFGFGAAMGLLYRFLTDQVKAPPALKGAVFGLFVWGTSYLGWLPQTGVLNQPRDQPARPNWLMIVAHLVWGISLGLLTERASRE